MIILKDIVRFIFIIVFCIFSTNTAFAEQKGPVTKNQNIIIENELHAKARIELSNSFYQIYRITERLARANKLDGYSWRIAVSTDKNLTKNAYVQDKNLIVLSSDFVDAYAGNISALAFVISHEMALKVLKNSAKITKYSEEFKTKIQDVDKLSSEDINNNASKCYVLVSRKMATSLGSCMEQMQKEQIENIKNNISKDFLDKQRQIESETDKEALIYMTKAGFNPNSAIGVLNFMKSIPQANNEETAASSLSDIRINNISSVLKSLNSSSLRKEGRINIHNSKALTYEKSINGRSIRINSRYNSDEDPEKSFEKL